MFLTESQELLYDNSFLQEASILVEQMLAGKGEIILEAGDEEKTKEAAEKYKTDALRKLEEIDNKNISDEEKLKELDNTFWIGVTILGLLAIIIIPIVTIILAVIAVLMLIIIKIFSIKKVKEVGKRLKINKSKDRLLKIKNKFEDKKVKEKIQNLINKIEVN
jgi:hypothetical protein